MKGRKLFCRLFGLKNDSNFSSFVVISVLWFSYHMATKWYPASWVDLLGGKKLLKLG